MTNITRVPRDLDVHIKSLSDLSLSASSFLLSHSPSVFNHHARTHYCGKLIPRRTISMVAFFIVVVPLNYNVVITANITDDFADKHVVSTCGRKRKKKEKKKKERKENDPR